MNIDMDMCVCRHTHKYSLHTVSIYLHIYIYICNEGLGGCQQQLTLHNRTGVYTRQLSFLPTIMREIESQEMLVFLSIRPNNNIIPRSFKKTSVFKRQSRKEMNMSRLTQFVRSEQSDHNPAVFFTFSSCNVDGACQGALLCT